MVENANSPDTHQKAREALRGFVRSLARQQADQDHAEQMDTMTQTYPAGSDGKRRPTHPGFLLADTIIPATGKEKAEIAGLLRVSHRQLDDILNEKEPVSPAIAARLGKLFGNGTAFWARMQASCDVWHAEHEVDVTDIETLEIGR